MRPSIPSFTFLKKITTSRLTITFFALALLHCIVQVVFQIMAFQTNSNAGNFLSSIIAEAGITGNWALLVQGGELRLCRPEDQGKNIEECEVVWAGELSAALDGPDNSDLQPEQLTAPPQSTFVPNVTITPVQNPSDSETDNVDDDTDETDSVDDDDEDRDVDFDDDDDIASTTTVFVVATEAAGENYGEPASIGRRLKRSADVIAIQGADGDITAVQLPSIQGPDGSQGALVDRQCVEMLVWPNQMIRNTKREDVTFIAFQFWVFGMSLVAILTESIPHTIAALLTHFLATIWSGYQLWNTSVFRSEFIRTTIDSKVCDGINLLPDYWARRNAAEIAVLVINVVSLVASAFLTWRLVKSFGWQTFKRIGASIDVNRIYKIVLTFRIGLQLSLFFIVASMGLWVDFLMNTTLGQMADNNIMYRVIAFIVMALMVPWIVLGWISVRKEHKILMSVFLSVCVVMLTGWGAMFASNTFRWTFKDWAFFSAMSAASSGLMLITTILGMVCLGNFDKGLKRFLAAQEPISDDDFGRGSDAEKGDFKVVFPSQPIPTYAAAFGSKERLAAGPFADPVPEYSQVTYGSQYSITAPAPAATVERMPSNASTASDFYSEVGHPYSRDLYAVERRNSQSSHTSGTSGMSGSTISNGHSYASAGSHHAITSTTKQGRDLTTKGDTLKKGWVIE